MSITEIFYNNEGNYFDSELVSYDSFEDIFIKNDISLVDFYAEGCKFCEQLKPTLDQLSDQGYSIFKYNALNPPSPNKQNLELLNKFEITGFPTVILFNNEGVVATEKIVGSRNLEKYLDAIQNITSQG